MNRRTASYVTLLILLISAIMFSATIHSATSEDASAPAIQWTKTYTGTTGTAVLQTSDQGYLIVSTPEISSPGTVLELIKTDSLGNQVWLHTYPSFPLVTKVMQTADGGFAIAGTSAQNGNQFFLAKLDSTGSIQWDYTYPDSRTDTLVNLISTNDGGYALLGNSANYNINDYKALLIKVDSSGNQLWSKLYGGSRSFQVNGLNQASDGGYIFGVSTAYFGSSAWLIKTDSSGNTQWFRPYQDTVDAQNTQIYANTCVKTSDGGFFLLSGVSWYQASSSGSDIYNSVSLAIKTDVNGDMQWNKTYQTVYSAAIQTSDGYVLGYRGDSAVILTKVDGLGSILWNGSYVLTPNNANFFAATSDNGLILIGLSSNHVTLIKLAPTTPAPSIVLPKATPHSTANSTIIQQTLLSGVDATSVIQTSDRGYAAVGQVSTVEGNVSSVLIKTDSSLNIQWSRPIYLDADTDMAMVVQTQDGGYAVVGERGTDAFWGIRFVLVKFSSTGQLLWNQTYPLSASSDMYNYLKGFIQTSDGGFLWAATTSYSDVGAPYIVRTSSTGSLLWAKSVTTPSGIPFIGISVSALVQAADGGFSIIGSDSPHSAISSSYFELIHLDANGNTLWNKSFGNQNGDFHSGVGDGIATGDGGYLLVGTSTSSYSSPQVVLLVKTDSQGNMLWYQTLDGVPISGAGAVCQTGDGGYVFASFTSRYPCLVKVTPTGQFQGIITLDAIFEYPNSASVADLKVSGDGAYVIAGQYSALNNTVNDFIWLAKVATYPGDAAPSPTPTTTPTPTVTPNPSSTPISTNEPSSNPTTAPTEAPTTNPTATPSIPEFAPAILLAAFACVSIAAIIITVNSRKKSREVSES